MQLLLQRCAAAAPGPLLSRARAGDGAEPTLPTEVCRRGNSTAAQEDKQSQGSFEALLCFKPFNEWPQGVFSPGKSLGGSGTQQGTA